MSPQRKIRNALAAPATDAHKPLEAKAFKGSERQICFRTRIPRHADIEMQQQQEASVVTIAKLIVLRGFVQQVL